MNIDTIDTTNNENEKKIKTITIDCEVTEGQTKWQTPFYRVVNINNPDEIYFAFKSKVNNGFGILQKKPSRLEIEYEEQTNMNSLGETQTFRHIINVFDVSEDLDFFI